MPALSPTMEEGALTKWHVKVGDLVRSGDVIAEIETDKATMEVEAVDEGVVEALLVAEGTEEVKVNTPIARLKREGEAASPPSAPPSPLRGGVKRRRLRSKQRRRPSRRRHSPHPRPLPPPRKGEGSAKLDPLQRLVRPRESSPARLRGASPRRPVSISAKSKAQGRMGGSSGAMSRD